MSVTDEQVVERLRALLAESDLQTTTEKMLRKKLEEGFGIDLTDRKAIIRKEIEKYLEEQADSDEEEEEEEGNDKDVATVRTQRQAQRHVFSEPLRNFLGVDYLQRPQVVKRIWDYIKANNLQDPVDRRRILIDDKLRTVFKAPLTMFSMAKQLNKHIKSTADIAEDSSSDEETPQRSAKLSGDKRSADERPKADKPKAKKAKAGDGAETGDADSAKRNNPFNRPYKLSEALANWCGTTSMGRSDLTKFFWAYVKEHKLQDPTNKQFILCDEPLKKVTGESRIQAFAIQKYLSDHLLKD